MRTRAGGEIGTMDRWCLRWGATLAMVASVALATATSQASGVDPTKISLPKGPGSIEGLASADFSPSLSQGSASYEVPIAVPPGSAGFGPRLALSYDTGAGVSEVAIGWRLGGLPKLRRRTENGLPHFDDTDTFELVGIGIPSELLEVSPGIFRPSLEDGSFVRVRRSADGTDWEARTKAGVTLRFGGAASVEAEGDHVSAYLLREELDRHGHRIVYDWDVSEGHALLKDVVWNDFDRASRNEIRFEYEARPDRHRRLSSGILETITRRLHSAEVRHGGELVRRYELHYGDEIHPSLQSIEMVGRDGTSRMPAARFEYTEATLESAAKQVVTMTNAPGRSPKDPDTTLADLNGDGLPDLLVARAGEFRSYVNHDGKRWLPASDWGSTSPSVSLSAKGVEVADVDADGAPDLLVKSGLDAFRYFPRPSDTRFDAPVEIARVPSFSFEDPDVRLADMDGDRRSDVVITTEAGIAVGFNENGADWTEPELVGPADAQERLLFSDGHTSLCDMNGDRVEDLCSLRSESLTYWLGRGRGRFEAAEVAEHVPSFDLAAPYQLIDINGDGWTDLVRVGASTVEFALAKGEGRFEELHVIDGTPPRGSQTAVQFADMNASGTTDIVWVDVSADNQVSWRYLEIFPKGRAGLLRRIDNGLGKVQTIDYEPAALHAARARDAGRPWTSRVNVAMPVVARVTVDRSMGDPSTVTELTYRDGTYDPVGRTFAGFAGCTRRQLGDDSTPTLVSELTFDTGLTHRELRSSPLTELLRDERGTTFARTTRGYTSRTLAAAPGAPSIGYSFASSELVEHVEGGARPSRSTLTEFEQDGYGNVVEERRWGEVTGSDFFAGNDEALVQRTFANDEDEWLLGYVATEEVTDGRGRRVSLTRKYYDGEPFQGLALGTVSRGDVSKEEAWVGPDDAAFELVIATKYDADGLPVETRDGVGGGRFFEWAPDHTSIASERVKLDSSIVLIERAEVDGAFGALLSATDYGGSTIHYEYDPFGRLTKVVKPGDSSELPTISYTYLPSAPLSRIVTETRVRSGAGDVERSETLFDGGGRERGTLTRDGDRWILAGVSLFDARGSARRTLFPRAVDEAAQRAPDLLDASPRGTDTFRDALGREVRTRSSAGIETRTEYAPLETRHWDGGQADGASSYEHTPTVERKDGLGRVVRHERTLGGKPIVSTYAYAANGALVERVDPEANTARYEYDGRGRRTAVHDADQGDTRFTFDSAGNLVSRTYPDGVTARFSFDLAGRSLTEDWNGDAKPELSRFWDHAPNGDDDPRYRGKLARVTEPRGAVQHTYDERGRVTATTYDIDGSSYVVRSEFDAQDREIVHVYPDGSSIEIRRNPRGQIAGYGKAIDIDYADDGVETARRFATGVRVDSGYDEERRRSELTFTARDGSVIEHLRWSYDAGGNVTGIADLRAGMTPERDRSESYAYDNLYRLTGVTGAWGHTSYRYSASGNLLGRTSTVAEQSIHSIEYGKRPHLPTSIDGRAIDTDSRGRMTADGARSYTWNDADQLVSVNKSDGSSVESVYGDEGIRRLRIEHHADGTSTTTHFIDAWTEAKDGKLVRYIVHGGQRIVKLADDNGITSATATRSPTRSAGLRQGLSSAVRAASTTSLGALCLLAFALTVVARIILRVRGRWSSLAACRTCFALTTRMVVAAACVFAGAVACSGDGGDDQTPVVDSAPRGSIQTLTDADTLIATDLIGSVLAETTGNGTAKGEFAAYPFGATRFDTSSATWKFAGTPRDRAVGLDHMGARFYAPDLGIWTSGDPVAIANPEKLVTSEFAAANPYAYANLTPVVAVDRDGNSWSILPIIAGAGAAAALEAAAQYISQGRIYDYGRIGAAGAGGAVAGLVFSLNPVEGVHLFVTAARAGVASGLTERLIASGGKDAGTLKDVAIDAATAVATVGVARGVTGALGRGAAVASQGRTAARAAASVRYGPMNPGPLPAEDIASFRGGSYTARTLSESASLYRVHGGRAGELGRFWTATKPEGPLQARIDLALKADWGNSATNVTEIRVPAGTTIYEGFAGPQGNLVGGGSQVVLPNVSPDWVIKRW